MEGINILSYTRWHPLQAFGFIHPLLAVHRETVIATWAILTVLCTVLLILRYTIAHNHELVRFIVMRMVRLLINLCNQTIGFFNVTHISFVGSLFLFIVACSTVPVFIPWLEEPTSDLNTPLALGVISFVYIQAASLKAHGLKGYLKEYFTPFFMFPLHVTGKIASIISISFRLFGNIFGGAIIMHIYNTLKMGSVILETVLLPFNIVMIGFFGIFEGFVFFMLTLTYLAIGIQSEEPEDHYS
jgi:F-type H+-transporting ATPase subunit a